MARRKSKNIGDHITQATPDAPEKKPRPRKTNEQRFLAFDNAMERENARHCRVMNRLVARKQAFVERARVKAQKAQARADAILAGLPEGE